MKEPLSRDAITVEALRHLATHGSDGMSLRKVATAVDTGPALLYAYVEDLNELQALVLDQAGEGQSSRSAKYRLARATAWCAEVVNTGARRRRVQSVIAALSIRLTESERSGKACHGDLELVPATAHDRPAAFIRAMAALRCP
ncbi:MAG: hypothetical protein ACREPQ_16840 [Rhodanobacter sp.]